MPRLRLVRAENGVKKERLELESLVPCAGRLIQAEGVRKNGTAGRGFEPQPSPLWPQLCMTHSLQHPSDLDRTWPLGGSPDAAGGDPEQHRRAFSGSTGAGTRQPGGWIVAPIWVSAVSRSPVPHHSVASPSANRTM